MDIISPTDTEKLKNIILRVERLEVEKNEIMSGINDVFAEAKSSGYDTKVIKQIIKLRKMDPSEREELEYLIDAYKTAIGL